MADKINFTKASLDNLPLPSAGPRAEYADTRQPGLRLRVTSTGTKTFCVLKRIKGAAMERITLDRYPAMSVEQARRKASEILGRMAEGNNPGEVRRALKVEPTLSKFFEEYGERHGSQKKSWRDDQQRFRDYLEKPLGNKKLSSITRDTIGRILSDMERDKKAGATVNNVRALASGIFSKAIEWDYLKENPVKGIKTRKSNKRDRFVIRKEMSGFFAALQQEDNETIRDFISIALLTGARRSNVLAMRWSEIDLEGETWRIPNTKNDTPQNVTLSPEAVSILTTRNENAETDFVFPGDGNTGHLVEPKKGWKRLLDRDELSEIIKRIEKAGGTLTFNDGASLDKNLVRAKEVAQEMNIEIAGCRMKDLRIHDLRRTLGSWQAMKGSSIIIIGKSLNHKSQQTTAIYTRLEDDPVRQSVNSANAAIYEAGGMAKATLDSNNDSDETLMTQEASHS